MKYSFKFVLLITVFVVASFRTYAQAPLLNETPAQRTARERSMQTETDLARRMQEMRDLDSTMRTLAQRDQQSADRPQLDQKSRERVRELRKVNPEDLEKYKNIVNKDNAGIFRLFPNFDCDTQNLIKIDGECAGFVPESSDFSFRVKMYTDPRYHDIGFERDQLVSDAFFSQGILVSLGNVPFEQVTRSDAALQFLMDLQTAGSPVEAKKNAADLKQGIPSGNLMYASHVKAEENTTYAMRMIAYKFGNSLPPPSSKSSMLDLKLLSLNYDERVDAIVVFRIIRREPSGNATIIWKELSRKDAPKLKFAKGEAPYDFKQ